MHFASKLQIFVAGVYAEKKQGLRVRAYWAYVCQVPETCLLINVSLDVYICSFLLTSSPNHLTR